jgi:epsilon-lactone hydrolase
MEEAMNTTLAIDEPKARTRGLSAWKRWLSVKAYGAFTSTFFGAHTPPLVMRRRFERFAAVSREAMLEKHPHLRFADHTAGSLAMESVCAVESPGAVIIHLHGGGYFMGSPASYRNRAMRLSYRCGAEVFVPDYRLAPEHPSPAALDDALAAFAHVRSIRPTSPVFVTGDSAGGGLALSLLVRLRERGERLPEGAILLSPWADLSGSGVSMSTNAKKDLWLSRAHLDRWGSYVLGTTDPRDPEVSPVFADLAHLSPLLIIVGGDEVLLDDATRVGSIARSAGTEVELLVGDGMQHDFPLTLPWLDESRDAWQRIARFVESRANTRRLTHAAE